MILQALVKYYEALLAKGEAPRMGLTTANVSYAVCLSEDGAIQNIEYLRIPETRGKKTVEIPRQMWVPEQKTRTIASFAYFLCDNANYMLGIGTNKQPDKIAEYFEKCKNFHLELLEGCNGTCAAAIRNFYTFWDPGRPDAGKEIGSFYEELCAGTGNLVFRVGDTYAHEDPELIAVWIDHCRKEEAEERGQCLVTGDMDYISKVHNRIKGIPGAQSWGAGLVSFNSKSYESYEREQGGNAPVGVYASFAYTTALNELLRNKNNHEQIGDMTVVFWSETAQPQYAELFSNSIQGFGKESDASKLKGKFQKIAAGEPSEDITLDSKFYVLGLALNASRIAVRFFVADQYGKFMRNIDAHYKRLEIIKTISEPWEFISPYGLLLETARRNDKKEGKKETPKIVPLLEGSLLKAILMNTRYPEAFINGIMIRIRAGDLISRGKAAGIKAYLLKSPNINEHDKEVLTVSLNEKNDNKAYVLGRLFALLERNQQVANSNGEMKPKTAAEKTEKEKSDDDGKNHSSTIKEQYFAAACAHPGTVFPVLLRLTNYHMAKNKYKSFQENDLGNVLDKLNVTEDPFPAYLDLKDQGIFILGYYHQRQEIYSNYSKKKEEKNEQPN